MYTTSRTAQVRESLPPPNETNASNVHSAWVFHCYLPFTDGNGVDHAWALAPFGPTKESLAVWNASEYSLAAGLAQATQYQALFEGFSDAAWAWYRWVPLQSRHFKVPVFSFCVCPFLAFLTALYQFSAVIMWKSAAPWPSLRGSLYDWYLSQSGGFWGARGDDFAG